MRSDALGLEELRLTKIVPAATPLWTLIRDCGKNFERIAIWPPFGSKGIPCSSPTICAGCARKNTRSTLFIAGTAVRD
tara:strand:- start:524 stop:757 length:234 start_codon:yes stop_codon:yes gene_type:complete